MIVSEPPALPPIRLQHKLWLDNLVDLYIFFSELQEQQNEIEPATEDTVFTICNM